MNAPTYRTGSPLADTHLAELHRQRRLWDQAHGRPTRSRPRRRR